MLSRKNRLNKKEVESVFKKGRKFVGIFLILKTEKEEEKSCSSFSAIVPVKVSKKSADRNKIKRRIRESLRKKLPQIKPGIKGIFIAMPEILNKSFKEIDEEVNKLLAMSKVKKS